MCEGLHFCYVLGGTGPEKPGALIRRSRTWKTLQDQAWEVIQKKEHPVRPHREKV